MLENTIFGLWQPVGFSTHQLAKQVSLKLNMPITHTGTLDPMAEGVLVLLSGEERFKKIEVARGRKIYEFEILFGISTDSLDGLGLITDVNFNFKSPTNATLKSICSEFVGEYTQQAPLFSAVKYKSKKLFEYQNDPSAVWEFPTKKGTIYKLQLLDVHTVTCEDALNNLVSKIDQIVGGPFRQDKIKEQWLNFSAPTNTVLIAKFEVELSRGMYVRALSQDICAKLGINGFTYSITRTQNGVFTKMNSLKLSDIFGENFDRKIFTPKVFY